MYRKINSDGLKDHLIQKLFFISILLFFLSLFHIRSVLPYSNNYNPKIEKGDTIIYNILNINEPPSTNVWQDISKNIQYSANISSQVEYIFDRTEVWSSSQYNNNVPQPFGKITIGDLTISNIPNEEIAKNLIQFINNYSFGFIIDLDWAEHETILNSLKCKVRYAEELIHWNWYSTFNIEYIEEGQQISLIFDRQSGVLLYMNTKNANYKLELLITETTIPLTPIIPLFVITFGLIFAYFTVVPLLFHFLFKPRK